VKRAPTAEIIAIGNELLIGHTLDTNSHWIAKQLTKHGWTLQRTTIIRDSLVAIRETVNECLQRRPNLTITLGGLGPTHDDMTLKGITQGLRRKPVLNADALAMIKARYAKLETSTGLTNFRKKMATMPVGAQPLPNPVGTAPGVLIKIRGSKLVSLPGVPSEMKAIFKGSIIPLLKVSNQQAPREALLGLVGIIESALSPALDRTRKAFPGLYFKSHPRGRETGVQSLIQLHIYNIDPDSRAKLDDAVTYLLRELSKAPRPAKK
jgi:nicotinamide-nucleotide amidase